MLTDPGDRPLSFTIDKGEERDWKRGAWSITAYGDFVLRAAWPLK